MAWETQNGLALDSTKSCSTFLRKLFNFSEKLNNFFRKDYGAFFGGLRRSIR